MNAVSLPDKVIAITRALKDIPHAFGGALALAYYAEPRATADIDLNVFVPIDRVEDVMTPLERLGVKPDDGRALIRRDGQARVFWDRTPVDLFFAYDPFHDAAAKAARTVPFADTEIKVLSPEHLTVCKVVFNRAKDWVDIDAMLDHNTTMPVAEVLRWVGRLVGDDDPRYDRIAALLST